MNACSSYGQARSFILRSSGRQFPPCFRFWTWGWWHIQNWLDQRLRVSSSNAESVCLYFQVLKTAGFIAGKPSAQCHTWCRSLTSPTNCVLNDVLKWWDANDFEIMLWTFVRVISQYYPIDKPCIQALMAWSSSICLYWYREKASENKNVSVWATKDVLVASLVAQTVTFFLRRHTTSCVVVRAMLNITGTANGRYSRTCR